MQRVVVRVGIGNEGFISARGETWERRVGEPKKGSYIWTDTWVKRNGKWQIVAAEDLLAPATAKKTHW